MADETLRLAATVEDQATGPLRKIQEILNGFKPTPGMRAMREEMEALRKNVQAVAGSAGVSGGMWGGVLGAGLTGGMVAGVTAAISSLDAYAKKVLEVRHIAKETGLGASDLKAFEKVGERFQIPKDQMDAGLKNWAATLDEVQRRRGAFYNELQHNDPALAEQLVNEKDTKKALGLYLSFLAKIKDAQAQKQWAELPGLGGFERLFIDGAEGFRKKWAEVASSIGKGSSDIEKQAEAFEHAIDRINDSLDKLTKRGAGPVLGWLATGLDSLGATMKQRGDEVDWFIEKMAKLRALMGSAPDADLSKSALLERKQRELRDLDATIGARQSAPMGDHDVTQERQLRQKLVDEIRRLTDEMAKAREAQAQKMSFDTTDGVGVGGGFGKLIQNASFGGGGLGGGSGGGGAFGMRGRYGGGSLSGGAGSGGYVDPGKVGPGTSAGHFAPDQVREAYIRQEASKRGIDPNVAMWIARHEGFGRYVGDKGTSFGDFQLHFKNNIRGLSLGGKGDDLLKRYGINAKDPKTWREQAQFSLDEMARGGLSPWHSWHGSPRAGLSGAHPIGVTRYDSDSARNDTSENRIFPPIRTRDDWSKASGAAVAPYPSGWNRRERDPYSLSNAARAAGVGGSGGPVKVDTDGMVKVELTAHGFGEGLRARTAMDGIVGSVRLNRGSAMPVASNRD